MHRRWKTDLIKTEVHRVYETKITNGLNARPKRSLVMLLCYGTSEMPDPVD